MFRALCAGFEDRGERGTRYAAAADPLVLVAVIENLPQAAEDLALPELEQLGSSHPNPEVQAAARARLTEFEEFHQ